MSDAQAEAGQAEVQGEGAADGLFDAHLQAIPDEAAREAALPALQSLAKEFNGKFDEQASYRKQWEPYEQLGLSQYDPKQLGELLQWSQQVGNDPQALTEWIQHLVAEGYIDPSAIGQPTTESPYQGLEGEGQESADPRVAQLEQQLQQLNEWREQQERHAQEQQIVADAQRQFSEVEQELGRKLTEGQKDAIYQLGVNKDGDDWILQGFKLFQQLGAEAQKEFVSNAEQRPQSPEKGTGAAEQAQPPTDFNVVKGMARERLAQSRR